MVAHVYLMAQDKVKVLKKKKSIRHFWKNKKIPFPRGKNCFESSKQDSTNVAFLVYPQLS